MLRTYFKTALRTLRSNISYTVIHVLGLAMGMTGALLIFLFLQYHLKTDRHQPHFDRIHRVVLDLILDQGTEHDPGSTLAMAQVLARDYPQVEKVGFIRKAPDMTFSAVSGTGVKRFVEKESAAFAGLDFMDLFSFQWLYKNAASELQEPYTVVISASVAEKYFGKTDVVGKTLRLNNALDLRIVGIVADSKLPSDLHFKILISLPTLKKVEPAYENEHFAWISSKNSTYVRLAEGATAASLQALLKQNGAKYYAQEARYYSHYIQPLADVHFDERYDGKIRRTILWILGGVGVFLLLIASINFVNLSTAQALKRAREIGVRKALGGTKTQLFWQFICETTVITVASALLALLLTVCLLPALNNWSHSNAFDVADLFQVELLGFWLIILLVVIATAGFYPAVIISGFNPVKALKSKPDLQQVGGLNLRRSLLVVQLTIAQVLVIGTIMLVMQMDFFRSADLGFNQNAVMTITLPKSGPELAARQAFKNTLQQLTDVQSVSYQFEAPASDMGYGGSVRFDNRADWEKFVIRERFGDEDYVRTYQMPLLAGRNIIPHDSITEFIVNEELMHQLGIRDPQQMIGKVLEDGNAALKGHIVGVVKSFHLKSLQSKIEPCVIFAKPELYKEAAVKLKTHDLARSVSNIRQVWAKIYPEEVFEYQFVDDKVARFYEKEAQLTSLIRSFSLMAIFICCLGLFGTVSFMVTQKTKEIGVRKVLGAGVRSILLLFGKEFVLLISIAFSIAAPVTWYMMSAWLRDFAYRMELSWWIPVTGGAFILLVTLATVGLKVLNAALMNPVKSLKMD